MKEIEAILWILVGVFLIGLYLNISNEDIFYAMVQLAGAAIAAIGAIYVSRRRRRAQAY